MPPSTKKNRPSRRSKAGRTTSKRAVGIPFERPILDARPDTLDFRDRMYEATLFEVPTSRPLKDYMKVGVPVLNQGKYGACAGYGLATVAHYLLRTRAVVPDKIPVSPWMLYAMAQDFDEHDAAAGYARTTDPDVGATARSAMKGWQKYGVCRDAFYTDKGPCKPNRELVSDSRLRPLGSYFRVNHKDVVAMHTALSEVGVLYATALIHSGWFRPDNDGMITFSSDLEGGHAFAIVGYDKQGFWIQNSWGTGWGAGGFGKITYDDWLQSGTDVWVARLGVPIELETASAAVALSTTMTVQSNGYAAPELDPHIISIGDDGLLRTNGSFSKSADEVKNLFTTEIPHFVNSAGWSQKRLVLYAHGGLVSEDAVVPRIGDYWATMEKEQAYLIGFVWHTDYWTTLEEILKDVVRSVKPEGILSGAKDFLWDRLDDTLEPIARVATGKAEWDKMKSNGMAASDNAQGGARIAAQGIRDLLASDPAYEVHLIGHSAGSIFLAPFIKMLTGEFGIPIKTCTLWAPACTTKVFEQFYVPAVAAGKLEKLALFTLDDNTERADNCANIYHKSLLYLVSDAFEDQIRIPVIHPDGEALLGMQKFISTTKINPGGGQSVTIEKWLQDQHFDWIKSPNNNAPEGSKDGTQARHHGDFSTDRYALEAALVRITGASLTTPEFKLANSMLPMIESRRQILSTL
jgi:hypothetical protein